MITIIFIIVLRSRLHVFFLLKGILDQYFVTKIIVIEQGRKGINFCCPIILAKGYLQPWPRAQLAALSLAKSNRVESSKGALNLLYGSPCSQGFLVARVALAAKTPGRIGQASGQFS